MNLTNIDQPVPVYTLEQDPIIGGRLFSMAQFEGMLTHQSELLVPKGLLPASICPPWQRPPLGRHDALRN